MMGDDAAFPSEEEHLDNALLSKEHDFHQEDGENDENDDDSDDYGGDDDDTDDDDDVDDDTNNDEAFPFDDVFQELRDNQSTEQQEQANEDRGVEENEEDEDEEGVSEGERDDIAGIPLFDDQLDFNIERDDADWGLVPGDELLQDLQDYQVEEQQEQIDINQEVWGDNDAGQHVQLVAAEQGDEDDINPQGGQIEVNGEYAAENEVPEQEQPDENQGSCVNDDAQYWGVPDRAELDENQDVVVIGDNPQQEQLTAQKAHENPIAGIEDEWMMQQQRHIQAEQANPEQGPQITDAEIDLFFASDGRAAEIGDADENGNRSVGLPHVEENNVPSGGNVETAQDRIISDFLDLQNSTPPSPDPAMFPEMFPELFGNEIPGALEYPTVANAERGVPEQEEQHVLGNFKEVDQALPGNDEQSLPENAGQGVTESWRHDQRYAQDGGNHLQNPPLDIPDQDESNYPDVPEDRNQGYDELRLEPQRPNNLPLQGFPQQILGSAEDAPQDLQNLQWIASALAVANREAGEGRNLRKETTGILAQRDGENHEGRGLAQHELQGIDEEEGHSNPTPAAVTRTSERKQLQRLPRTGPQTQRMSPPSFTFSSYLRQLRYTNKSCDQTLAAIAIPRLPSLHEEMEAAFQPDSTEMIPWTAEETSSLTLTNIANCVTPSGEQSVVRLERLFNHVFQLSRSSFLQREEMVHLKLITHFFNTLSGEETEKAVKELVVWLEKKFDRTHLATMVQKLVNSIVSDDVTTHLVERAKLNYNPSKTTLLGAFYTLSNEHSEIIEKVKETTKTKREVDKAIKKAKEEMIRLGQTPPKATYGRNKARDVRTLMSREKTLLETFAATRWLVVGSGDAHYEYGCAILQASKEIHKIVEIRHGEVLEKLKEDLRNPARENNDVVNADVVARRIEMMEKLEKEELRPVCAVESIVLKWFTKTVAGLCKIELKDLLLRTAGKMPVAFAKALGEIGDELNKLRSAGSRSGIVVGDIVKFGEMVEKEKEKGESATRQLKRKMEYLKQCRDAMQEMLETWGGSAAEADT